MSAWLHRQKKGDLVELAKDAELGDTDAMLKDELADALDEHLKKNASSLSTKQSLNGYYSRASPTKTTSNGSKTAVAGDADETKAVTKSRRKTIKKDEIESPYVFPSHIITRKVTSRDANIQANFITLRSDSATPTHTQSTSSTALATRTPRAVQRIASRVPLPASPAQMTEMIERQSAAFNQRLNAAWDQSGAIETVHWLREGLSSTDAVGSIIALIEGLSLSRTTLPLKYAFTTPPVKAIGVPSIAWKLPDLFQLLTKHFWVTSFVWLTTSAFVPLVFSYLFNWTYKTRPRTTQGLGYATDPLSFHLVKALLTWMVYYQGVRFYLLSDRSVEVVDGSVWGGAKGMIAGALVGIVTSMYQAILRK
ncbi:MAG: hypothetical protein M1820_005139 [Bogoriella megaspora]|nr:MAG: hypothetical protein M1820_005139 [Bogoriella megaspora]